MTEKNTATHRTIAVDGGYRFLFYCDLSGAHACTTEAVYDGDPQGDALLAAWKAEGYKHFNRCQKCGRWVIDAVYNADALECVDCAPFQCEEPRFCRICGTKIKGDSGVCPHCGNKLLPENGEEDLK